MASILIIDDDRLVRLTLEQMVLDAGHVVWTANSGRHGIDICSSNPIDLVITDVLMPGTDGIEVLVTLKRLRPKLKFIVISGGGRTGTTDFLVLAKELGADGILHKPFDDMDLKDLLTKILDEEATRPS